MDFPDVDQILIRHGLAQEPAFDKVGIAIRPIPDMDGCPLGLYYPDSALIIIPPDGHESALLHELGHRYGHYYRNDISERYAESFRQQHQKGTALMYSGSDFGRLASMGRLFSEGERGTVVMAFSGTPPSTPSLMSEYYAYSNGEPLPKVSYGQDSMRVEFTQGVDWLSVTAAILGGMTLAGIVAMGYAIYKTAKESPWVIPLVLFGSFAGLLLGAGVAAKKYRR